MTLFWIGIADQLHISVGEANLLVCAILLTIVFFLDRHQIHVGSILNPIVIALVTDQLAFLDLHALPFAARVALMVAGFAILALGIAVYALADYGKGAYEAVVFTICERAHTSVGIIRTLCDIMLAILGVLLGAQAAIGTLLAILCMGSGITLFLRLLTTTGIHKLLPAES